MFFKKNNCFFVLLSLLAYFTQAAQTFETDTIFVENRSPIVQLFSLSRPEFHPLQKQGTFTWKPRVEVINYISSTQKQGDFFLIDGETVIASNTLQYQFNKQTQLFINIPWLNHDEGFTDGFIYNFHDIFQLPQNGRTQENQDLMRWSLRTRGKQILSINDNSMSGLGDIQLKASWTPTTFQNIQLTSHLKLPTGRYKNQTGSENFDFGLSAIQINPGWLKNRPFLKETPLSFWYGAGVSYLGKPKGLSDFNRFPVVLTFRTGVAWLVSNNWQLKTQLDSNSPLLDTKIRELGWYPVQISMATSHAITKNTQFNFVIVEDLRPRSAPDVIFTTGLSVKF